MTQYSTRQPPPTEAEEYWRRQFESGEMELPPRSGPDVTPGRFVRSAQFSDHDSRIPKGERGFARHIYGLLNYEVAVCDDAGCALRGPDDQPVGFTSAMCRWNGSDPNVYPVDEWIPEGWFTDADSVNSFVFTPDHAATLAAVTARQYPGWDDGASNRRLAHHPPEAVATMMFGDWCLPVGTREADHLTPCTPHYATRNCRTAGHGTAGDDFRPHGALDSASAASRAPDDAHNVDVLRATRVDINEAFLARYDRVDCVTPGTMWFGVNRSRYGQNPFISQRWDEVMHLVSDWDPLRQRRHFHDGVRFKGGFKRARQAWRYATLLLDERTPYPPSLTSRLRASATRAAPVRYYVIRIGTHPATGAIFERYITADESIYRALRTDHRSVGARFDCFDAAQAYVHNEPRDVPPSVVFPEFQVALGPNNAWLDFHSNRLWEYRTAWEGRYSLTADVNAMSEDGGSAGLAEELRFFEAYLETRSVRDVSVGHAPEDPYPTSRRRQAPLVRPRTVSLAYHYAAEYQRLQKCGDYRCPPGRGPALTRPLDSEWWSSDIPWYNSGPFGVPLDVSCSLGMLGYDTDTEIALYHSQFAEEFTDWETTIVHYELHAQQRMGHSDRPPAVRPPSRGPG